MDINIIICFCHAQLCTNQNVIPNFFPMRFHKMVTFSCFLASLARTTDEVEHHGVSLLNDEFLGLLSSNTSI